VALTDMGRKLFAIAERQFEAETEAMELLSRGRTLEEGQLTIGADAAVHILPELARFRLKHPKLSVRLVTGNSAQLVKRLEDFSIDIAITAERPPGPAFLARKLRSDRLVAVVQRSSRLAKLPDLPFAQLLKLPLILPSIGIISILTFVGNFNAFDLIYVAQGALAGPDFSTDILGTFLYRTFFGFQLQLGDPHMGATIATAMFGIILIGVCIYLFGIQTRLRRYQF
jgi:DNA-binding transcriptional LysR family regulator